MTDLLAARAQMALSLGFHIVFACIGMTMPVLMTVAEWRYRKTGDAVYRDLAKAWSKGVAVFFAVGAVSGTVLSMELGLLWPTFMQHAGPIIGMPFSLEGAAFFVEAIAMGLYLYGWDRLSPRAHLASGVVVGAAGIASGVLVVSANGFMNSPRGFEWVEGRAIDVDPVAAMLNDAWFSQALHMTLAAFVATGFAVAGVHAIRLLRHPDSRFHRAALHMALVMAGVAAILQPISGDISAKDVARRQPIKLAAMEAHFETERGAGLLVGGIPDEETGTVSYGVRIPHALSFLAFADPNAEVRGLEEFPREDWPPVLVCHFAFQIMVGLGTLMMLFALGYFAARRWRPALLEGRPFLRAVTLLTPAGFIAVEAGWVVTEVGRQPWILYGVMRTKDAVTPMPGITVTFAITTAVYVVLTAVTATLLARQIRHYERLEPALAVSPSDGMEGGA